MRPTNDWLGGDWIQTYTGKAFWPLDPLADEVSLADIAHSLSLQCRFAGHIRRFYSVGQHSIMVARNVPLEDRKWALLHDASEAYLVDLPRPIKYHGGMGSIYREIEDKVMAVICERFGISPIMPASVKHADNVLLMTEKRDLLGPGPAAWFTSVPPLDEKIHAWPPELAEFIFLSFARELGIE